MKQWKYRSRPDLFRKLPAITGKLLAAEDMAAIQRLLMEDVHSLLGVDTSGYNRIEDGHKVRDIALSRPFDAVAVEAAQYSYHLDHELPRSADGKRPETTFYTCDPAEEVGIKAFRERDIARYVYRPLGGDFVFVYHSKPVPNIWSSGFILRRNFGFSDDEVTFMTLINQVLHARLQVLERIEQAQRPQTVFGSARDAETGYLITNAAGTLFGVSRGAEPILDVLHAHFPTRLQLPDAMLQALQRSVQSRRPERIELPDGRLCQARYLEAKSCEDRQYFALALLETAPTLPPLTPREQEVALWVAEGKTNPEIGAILGISPRTVSKHIEHILSKWCLENRAGILLHWRRRGGSSGA